MFYQNSSFQKTYDFRVQIGTSGVGFLVKSITLPNYALEIKQDLLGRDVQHTPAKGTWQPVTIEFYDHKYRVDGEQDTFVSVAHRLFETLVQAKGGKLTGGTNTKVNVTNILQTDIKTQTLPDIIIKKIYNNQYQPAGTPEAILTGAPGAFKIPGKHVSEQWTLRSPILAGIDFGKMDYSSEDLNIITMVINYSNAFHITL